MTPRKPTNRRLCPVCRGTGLGPALNRRVTSGGRDDRTCGWCLGECFVEPPEAEEPSGGKKSADEGRAGDA